MENRENAYHQTVILVRICKNMSWGQSWPPIQRRRHSMIKHMALSAGLFAVILIVALAVNGEETTDRETGYVDVPGGRLFYERSGSGDAMILIHDGLVHHEVWDAQFEFFCGDHAGVRYDRRGYGRSELPQIYYDNVEDLNQVFEQLGIDRAALMGMSAGGGLAIDFTLKYPEKVTSLVLVGAVVSGYGFTPHFYTRGGRLTAADYADEARLREYWLSEDPYEVAPENEAARARVQQLLIANPQNMAPANYRLRKQPERPALGALGEISVPVLVVVGEHDIPDVHAHAGAIQAGIPGAERIIIQEAGHLVPLEQPDLFNEQVGAFAKEAAFFEIITSQGVDGAWRALKDERSRNADFVPFRENRMNQMGYEALQTGDVDRATGLFRLNVLAFPQSWNVYDSLGEAYAAGGERDSAIVYYERSLELNPENANGRDRLEELKRP
jgi:3-oxoadipate enol-lactonase